MKIERYAQLIQRIATENPGAEVVFSIDEEGNGFKPVVFAPQAGAFDGVDFDPDTEPANAVCIN